jgi:hypothetical protein
MERRLGAVHWRVVTYRLAAEASRHRVAVWRELRRAGAVPAALEENAGRVYQARQLP